MDTPPFLQHLRQHKRMPVPYFVAYVGQDPDFRLHDAKKQHACLSHRKCAICGKPLPAEAFLISGPLGLKNRVSSDTWMHQACAQFSLDNCPYLSRQHTDRREAGLLSHTLQADYHAPNKPAEVYLIRTDKYQVLRTSQGPLINYRPLASLRHTYVDGRLTPDPAGWQKQPLGLNWKTTV